MQYLLTACWKQYEYYEFMKLYLTSNSEGNNITIVPFHLQQRSLQAEKIKKINSPAGPNS